MKKNSFTYSVILFFVLLCITFIFACGRTSSSGKTKRYEAYWIDTTWIIPQSDSIIWKHGRIIISTTQWREGDTLRVISTREKGPYTGRIYFSKYKNSSYQEIKKDTVYDVNWSWAADTSDTVMVGVVNTSSNDSLQVKIKIGKIQWYTDPAVLP